MKLSILMIFTLFTQLVQARCYEGRGQWDYSGHTCSNNGDPKAKEMPYEPRTVANTVWKATVVCERKTQGDIYHLEAYLQFADGFNSYGPIKNSYTGEMAFSFQDGTVNSVAYTQVSGYQLKGSVSRTPDYWIFRTISKNGEIITVDLQTDTVSDHDKSGYLFGKVTRQDGQEYLATCRYQIHK